MIAVAQGTGLNLQARQTRLYEITQQVFQLPNAPVGREVP